MARKRSENREGPLGHLGSVKPVHTKDELKGLCVVILVRWAEGVGGFKGWSQWGEERSRQLDCFWIVSYWNLGLVYSVLSMIFTALEALWFHMAICCPKDEAVTFVTLSDTPDAVSYFDL
ncbi:hypothetical protein TNCV_3513641 [Trichonephila clavipes]|nr:hypothetical protein TNCV_3513641 [Trichonephila clavipes]